MKSTLTTWALQLNAKLITEGGALTITRAAGLNDSGEEEILFSVYENPVRSGARFTLPLYYLNSSVAEAFYISRIEIYAKDGDQEGLYAYVDLDTPQGVSARSQVELFYNLVIEIVEAGDAIIDVTSIKWLSKPEADVLYAPIAHTHPATQVHETTGETTEEAQRRQDAMLQQLAAYIGGVSILWTFPGTWIVEHGIVSEGAISTSLAI